MARKKQNQGLGIVGVIFVGLYMILQHFGILPGPSSPDKPSAPVTTGSYDTSGLPNAPGSFSTSTKWLYEKVYQGHEQTFYCDCRFDANSKEVDRRSCGVTVRENAVRANRIEAEHLMPAHRFGGHLECWQNPKKVCPDKDYPGRTCCEKAHPVYEIAQNDLSNLVPAVGEINADRSNYPWVESLPSQYQYYGNCTIRVDTSGDQAAPPASKRGAIARSYLYMERTYGAKLGFQLSPQEKAQYTAWASANPPDDWEYERNNRITQLQGIGNPFITIGILPDETVQDMRNAPPAEPGNRFACEPKKTCGEMQSCEEAKFHLTTCGNTGLDRDGDGQPCTAVCGG